MTGRRIKLATDEPSQPNAIRTWGGEEIRANQNDENDDEYDEP